MVEYPAVQLSFAVSNDHDAEECWSVMDVYGAPAEQPDVCSRRIDTARAVSLRISGSAPVYLLPLRPFRIRAKTDEVLVSVTSVGQVDGGDRAAPPCTCGKFCRPLDPQPKYACEVVAYHTGRDGGVRGATADGSDRDTYDLDCDRFEAMLDFALKTDDAVGPLVAKADATSSPAPAPGVRTPRQRSHERDNVYYKHRLSAAHKAVADWNRTRCGSVNQPGVDIITEWGATVTPASPPLPEYPRPQMVRDPSSTHTNANGLWEFQLAEEGDSPPFGLTLNQTILVPFPLEACLSGAFRWPSYSQHMHDPGIALH
jgi:hypothetical protein